MPIREQLLIKKIKKREKIKKELAQKKGKNLKKGPIITQTESMQ